VRVPFLSDGSTATLRVPALAVERRLLTAGPLQVRPFVPGSATEALLAIDVATGAVAVAYGFTAPVLLGELGPFAVEVEQASDAVGGFLPSFRFCDTPPRCIFVPGEPYDPATGLLLAIGPGTADGVGSTLVVFDAELSEVPEPGDAALLLGALFAWARRRRRRLSALGVVACASALAGCGDPIEVMHPPAGAVLMAPDVQVELAFAPPVAGAETLHATLTAGLDAAAGPAAPQDVTGDIALAAGGASATLPLADLPPGRSRVLIELLAQAGGEVLASRSLTLDRGGYFGAAGSAFGAGAHYRQLARTTRTGATRNLDVVIWYPTDVVALPTSPLELDLRAVLDAPLVTGASALPLLLYSHGSCGWEGEVGWLANDLARIGFLVAATSHPGNTSGSIVPCDAPGGGSQRAGDVRALLDAVLTWNQDPAWPLAGAIDPSRIGVSGFSAGGFTARQLTTLGSPVLDHRLRAALVLANGLFAIPSAVPTMFQGGLLDAAVPIDELEAAFDGLLQPRFLVEVAGANHRSFANDCLEPFFDCLSSAADREATQTLIRRYARGFVHRYVAEDVRGAELLAEVPGVTLLADP
jgi:predicted dienelactone hydrolase